MQIHKNIIITIEKVTNNDKKIKVISKFYVN